MSVPIFEFPRSSDPEDLRRWAYQLVTALTRKSSLVVGTDGKDYICYEDHTAAAATKPITGASWKTVWRDFETTGEGDTWKDGYDYASGGISWRVVNTTGSDNKDLGSAASDGEYESITLTDLTANRLIASDTNKLLVSVAALSAWIAGTTSQVIITDDGDGTITISLPQDIHTGASPTFVGMTLSGLTASRLVSSNGSKALVSVANLASWIAGTSNEITVTDDGDGTVTLSIPTPFHVGDGTNQLVVETDGTIKFEGTATVWDDLQVNLGSVQRGASAPTWTAYKSSEVLAFSSSASNSISFNVQMPHGWKEGTNVFFHIHWVIPVAGAAGGAENIRWDFTHSWANIDAAFPAPTSAPSIDLDVQNDSADTHYVDGIEEIDGTGQTLSSILLCSLTRDHTVANDYASAVYLVGMDFHYQIDTVGSRQEFTK